MANNFVNSVSQGFPAMMTPVYTVPSTVNHAAVIGFSLANTSMAPIGMDIAIETIGPNATTTYILRNAILPFGSSYSFIDATLELKTLILMPNQRLSVLPYVAQACDCEVSVLEVSD